MNQGAYDPEKDGDVEDYIAEYSHGGFPLFFGWEQYRMLIKKRIILPGKSGIRFMLNQSRGDLSYTVTRDFRLEGLEMGIHSGEKGIFKPKEVFTKIENFFKEIGDPEGVPGFVVGSPDIWSMETYKKYIKINNELREAIKNKDG